MGYKMERIVFIYGLRDPRDDVIKYVGKTNDLRKRLNYHLKGAGRHQTPKNNWLLKLKSLGLKPEMMVLEEVPENKWEDAERSWIEFFRCKSDQLKNICDGGKGRNGPLSEEAKRRLSMAGKGRKLSRAAIAKISERVRGRKLTEETKEKIRQRAIGRKHTDAAKLKMSLAHRGKKKSAEHRRKIGLAHKGKVMSAESRVKMSRAKYGWRPSEALTTIQREKCKGEGNGRAKLTEEQVLEIRRRYAEGSVSLIVLAEDYPVEFGTIHRIVTRQLWKHI